MYVYIYIFTCLFIYVHIYRFIYIYVYILIYIYINTYVYTYICICIYIHMFIHIIICTYVYIYKYKYVYSIYTCTSSMQSFRKFCSPWISTVCSFATVCCCIAPCRNLSCNASSFAVMVHSSSSFRASCSLYIDSQPNGMKQCKNVCWHKYYSLWIPIYSYHFTGLPRPIRCLIFTDPFPKKNSIVSGFFAKKDLQLGERQAEGL